MEGFFLSALTLRVEMNVVLLFKSKLSQLATGGGILILSPILLFAMIDIINAVKYGEY